MRSRRQAAAAVVLTATVALGSACAARQDGSAASGTTSTAAPSPSLDTPEDGGLVTAPRSGPRLSTTSVPPLPSLDLLPVEEGPRCTFRYPLDESFIRFLKGSAVLTLESGEVLRALAPALVDAETIEVAGHASTEGNDAENQVLSDQRAAAVAAFLSDLLGRTVASIGYGETSTTVVERSEADRALNRRVVITVQRPERVCSLGEGT